MRRLDFTCPECGEVVDPGEDTNGEGGYRCPSEECGVDFRVTVELDCTSDSCAIMAWTDSNGAFLLGSLDGSSFEDSGDGQYYAMIGESRAEWAEHHPEVSGEEIDTMADEAEHELRTRVLAEIAAAGCDWVEI